MLSNITIGQFFPGNSFIHKLDPRNKIILTLSFIIMIFLANNALSLLFAVVFVFFIYSFSSIPISMIFKSLKPIIPIIIFTSVLNMIFVNGANPLFEWGFLKITQEGVSLAVFMTVRLVCLIAGSSLLTYTTSPVALTDAIERLLSWLKIFKFPVHELAMMMTIALRFIPTLIEETDKIICAQKARGADVTSGSIIRRAKALIPILIPLFVSSFRRADELALAMECRCYRGGKGRTRMKILKLSFLDYVGFFFIALAIAATFFLNSIKLGFLDWFKL